MRTLLTSLFATDLEPVSREDAIRREWECLLDSAASPKERDEINDVFGRSLAA